MKPHALISRYQQANSRNHDQQCVEYRKEIAELKASLGSSNAEVRGLNAPSHLEETGSQLKVDIVQERSKSFDLRRKLEKAQLENSMASETFAIKLIDMESSHKVKLEILLTKIDEMQDPAARLVDAEECSHALRNQNHELTRKVKDCKLQVKELDGSLQHDRTESEARIAELECGRIASSREIGKLQLVNGDLSTQISVLENRVKIGVELNAILQADVDRYRSELKRVQDDVAGRDSAGKLELLQSKLDTVTIQLSTVQSEVATARSESDALRKSNDKLQRKNELLIEKFRSRLMQMGQAEHSCMEPVHPSRSRTESNPELIRST